MRQATAELQSRGLTLGKLLYRSDMATDNVLGQQRGGTPIAPGTQVESGTAIDLVVGLNSSDYTSLVPNLSGMAYMTAVDAIHSNSLNLGQVVCDTAIVSYSDSLRAVVYKQRPSSNYKTSKGSPVSIYITLTPEKYEKPKSAKKSKSTKKSKK
jgi:beta-lactam-binding protein with PASTA domain